MLKKFFLFFLLLLPLSHFAQVSSFNKEIISSDSIGMKEERQQRKVTEFDFCPRILLHPCCGISTERMTSQKVVELNKKWAVEDSLFNMAEKKRCAALRDSLHLIRDFETDSVVERELIIIGQFYEDILDDSNKDSILDSLVNVIEPIDTSLDTSIRVKIDFEKDLSQFGKIYTGDTTTKECRALRNFRVLEYSPDDLERRSQVDSASRKTNPDFSFYPNPANGFITMEFKNIQVPSDFDIVDMKGRKIATEKISGTSQTLNISGFSPGVYFIVLNSGYRVRKLIIE